MESGRKQRPKGALKLKHFNGIVAKLEPLPKCPLGSPRYEMGNASNFRRWIGGASNAQSEYVSPSIKDQERTRRGTRNKCFEISGPEQIQSTSGKDLVKNQTFKEEFSVF